MHPDHLEYYKFHSRSSLDKAINTLIGIVEGISADSKINDSEIQFLASWIDAHKPYKDRHPFNEFIPVVSEAISDGILTDDERSDILWLCEKMRSTEYFDSLTADIQRLHSVVGAIAADGIITEEELDGLSGWLESHEHLKRCWPYDEVEAVVTAVMSDRKIDEEEHIFLQEFFSEFIPIGSPSITQPPISTGSTVQGLCAVCPDISFQESLFCFTGASAQYKRKDLEKLIIDLGGRFTNSINQALDYLIIGAAGNPCWAYACYGRKVEKAVTLRKQGHNLLLVHENDFQDAVEDANCG